uniref:glycerophosphodiester phosphodiesterase n=1 Tax=Nonomuraea pusilla TaxID=46177 RepID=UPI000AAF9F60|nr:glycerophosphodiester phosphodiesterase [Nonomuraea pusilla]
MTSPAPAARTRRRIVRGTLAGSLLIVLSPVGVASRPAPAGAAPKPGAGRCLLPAPVSHRGYDRGVSENTLGAFRQALAAGSRRVEFDVRFTRDHHPVLMHDATVGRTTTGSGAVAGMSLARFLSLRTEDGQRPPTLLQALSMLRGKVAEALVELKVVPGPADLRALKDAYRRADAYRWASLTSFSPAALQAARSVPARKGLLSATPPPNALARRFGFVAVRYDHLSGARLRAYRVAGLPVYAWTPDDPADWRRLADAGVARIVTDRTPAYLAWARRTCARGAPDT